MKPPTNPTALITGASRGLGRSLAQCLVQRGWTLIINARRRAGLEETASQLARHTRVVAIPGNVIAIPGDVNDPAHRRALAQAAARAGGLDAVINNAGMLGPSPQPDLLHYPLPILAEVFRTNVVASLGVLQAVQGQLKPGARIINITSDAGIEAYPGWGGYGASKATLEQLSAVLAVENEDLRVYWVDPGDMRTDMHQRAFPGEDISDRPLPDEVAPGFLPLLEGDLPSGRYSAAVLRASPDEHSVPIDITLSQ